MIRRIPIPTAVSVTAIALAAIVILMQLPALLIAIVGPGADGEDPGNEIARILEEHQENQTLDRDRFNGRSLFYRPQPPRRERPRTPRPTRPEPKVDPPTPVDPGPPPPPATYQGPSINFTVGSDVWFMAPRPGEKGFRVRVGEEREGVSVISVNLPWSVKVGYRGGEYDVNLLERRSEQFFGAASEETTDHSSMIKVTEPAVVAATPPATDAARGGDGARPAGDQKRLAPPSRNPLRRAATTGGGSRSVELASTASGDGDASRKSARLEASDAGGLPAPADTPVTAPGRPTPAPPTPASDTESGDHQAPWREVGGDEKEADREKTGEGEEEGEADNAEPVDEEDGEDGDPPS